MAVAVAVAISVPIAIAIGAVGNKDPRDAHVVLESVEEEDATKEQSGYREEATHTADIRGCLERMRMTGVELIVLAGSLYPHQNVEVRSTCWASG